MQNKFAINTVTNKRPVIADVEFFRKEPSDIQKPI